MPGVSFLREWPKKNTFAAEGIFFNLKCDCLFLHHIEELVIVFRGFDLIQNEFH